MTAYIWRRAPIGEANGKVPVIGEDVYIYPLAMILGADVGSRVGSMPAQRSPHHCPTMSRWPAYPPGSSEQTVRVPKPCPLETVSASRDALDVAGEPLALHMAIDVFEQRIGEDQIEVISGDLTRQVAGIAWDRHDVGRP